MRNDVRRNYGIDALKILSMYMVVVLHVLGTGGVMDSCDNTFSYYVASGLQTMAYCAVNLFGMTTGYLMFNRKIKCARIIDLWLLVAFYGIVITILAKFVFSVPISGNLLLSALLPVTFREYWYFSAYFGLFFLIPFLNKLLATLSKKQDFTLTIVLLILVCITTVSPKDPFCMGYGYGLLWLCILYILGALIHKYEDKLEVKSIWLLLGYVIVSLVTLLSRPVIGGVTRVLGISVSEALLLQYNSITIVAMTIFLVLLFIKLKLPTFLQKVTVALAPLSFAVYIIHEQPIIRDNIVESHFSFLSAKHWAVMVAGVLLAAAAIYIVCTLIEFIRTRLFNLMRINRLSNKLGSKLDSLFED